MNYAIILEDDILYCSNTIKYNTFEIVIFVEKLLRSINPKHKWRLSDICLEGFNRKKECMLIKHVFTENNENLFYCLTGDFETKIPIAQKILNEFYEKVESTYQTIDQLKQASNPYLP